MNQNLGTESNIEKEINDPSLLGQVIKSLFLNMPVSMIFDGDETPVKVLNAEKEFIIIKSTGRKDFGDRLLTFTNNGSLYHFHFNLKNKVNQADEYLEPYKLVIMKNGLRKHERIPVKEVESKSYYIQSFIKVEEIFPKLSKLNSLNINIQKMISSIEERFLEVEFIHTEDSDFRIKLMKISGLPIFLANSRNHSIGNSFINLKEMKEYFGTDEWEEIQGPEISIPIYFKGKILLGYIKVRTEIEFELDDVTFINTFVNNFTRIINKEEGFEFSKEKGKILDLSNSGVGFLHPRIGYENVFRVGEKVLMEMHMDKGLFANFQIIIRNNSNINENSQRIGAEFFELSEEESIFLKNFSEKL
ncbi:MAG: PilZ domain-containing protein [Leptospiraceae bacterium]|nr:PilZ domain-containing protein [Leptospiraceae bacterium]